jgi:nucleoside-diphosphate-sugar epimerase
MDIAAPDALRVLVTGADGFVGRHLQQALSARAIYYRVAVRRSHDARDPRCFAVGA